MFQNPDGAYCHALHTRSQFRRPVIQSLASDAFSAPVPRTWTFLPCPLRVSFCPAITSFGDICAKCSGALSFPVDYLTDIIPAGLDRVPRASLAAEHGKTGGLCCTRFGKVNATSVVHFSAYTTSRSLPLNCLSAPLMCKGMTRRCKSLQPHWPQIQN